MTVMDYLKTLNPDDFVYIERRGKTLYAGYVRDAWEEMTSSTYGRVVVLIETEAVGYYNITA